MVFADLGDYLQTRARETGYSTVGLSEALGFGRSYINSIINNQFKPSAERCWKIADFFGDDPAIILGLAGYLPPGEDSTLSDDLVLIAKSLPDDLKAELMRYARYLKSQALARDRE
jgi:transcriptional regulator with XRE-family HTH domain